MQMKDLKYESENLVFPGKNCQCKAVLLLWRARQQFWLHSFSINNCLPCVSLHTKLVMDARFPKSRSSFCFPFLFLCSFFEEQVSSFQHNSKAGLTEIYGHVWCCFIGWWLILQSRRWMKSLWAKVLKSLAGG